jgi:hypothetical protein
MESSWEEAVDIAGGCESSNEEKRKLETCRDLNGGGREVGGREEEEGKIGNEDRDNPWETI